MPEKPLCKDCRWIATGLLPDPLFPKCNHHEADHSLVDGDPVQKCAYLRIDPQGFGANLEKNYCCGLEGRWFEAQEEVSSNLRAMSYGVINLDKALAPENEYKLPLTAGERKTLCDLLEHIKQHHETTS